MLPVLLDVAVELLVVEVVAVVSVLEDEVLELVLLRVFVDLVEDVVLELAVVDVDVLELVVVVVDALVVVPV